MTHADAREPDLRVITLSAHDAAQRLRRSPEIELVRAEDPLDAVAELARPIGTDSPARTAMIVGTGAVPADELSDFLAASQTASPGVVLLQDGDGPADAGFHGVFGRQDDPDALSGTIPAERPAAAKRESRENTEKAPRERALPADSPTTDDPVDAEQALLEAVLTGRATVDDALDAASTRLGARARLRDHGEGAPVERRGRRWGVLYAPGVSEKALRLEATKLACWLALQEQLGQLRHAAFVDDLTGAWNRGFFRRRLPRVLEAARAARRDVTLMIYDIDDFKHYNDEFGHGAGDEILRETVKLLRSVIRPTDLVCRIGGDEFAVIFDDPREDTGERGRGRLGKHPKTIAEITRRFQKQICEHRFPALTGGARSTLTISGGAATFPWDGSDPEALVKAADELLMESKRRGKNAITLGPGADLACRVEFPTPDS